MNNYQLALNLKYELDWDVFTSLPVSFDVILD